MPRSRGRWFSCHTSIIPHIFHPLNLFRNECSSFDVLIRFPQPCLFRFLGCTRAARVRFTVDWLASNTYLLSDQSYDGPKLLCNNRKTRTFMRVKSTISSLFRRSDVRLPTLYLLFTPPTGSRAHKPSEFKFDMYFPLIVCSSVPIAVWKTKPLKPCSPKNNY
jgi:hypothetical protein